MSTKAQKFAQNRNRSGGTLKGVLINLEQNVRPACTSSEQIRLDDAISQLKILQENWTENYENAKQELL